MGARKADPKLIKVLVKAQKLKKLLAGGGTHLEEFVVQAKLNASYFIRISGSAIALPTSPERSSLGGVSWLVSPTLSK
jgi:hypothetical protein